MTAEFIRIVKDHFDRRYPDPKRYNPVTIYAWDGIEVTYDNAFYARLGRINFNNLRLAELSGRTPFSFEAVLGVIDEQTVFCTVLHDTPDKYSVGNHWRVIGRNPESGSVILCLCNNSGNSDVKGIRPVEVPENKPFFTGFDVHDYQDIDKPGRFTLSEVTEILASGYALGKIWDKSVTYFHTDQGVPTMRTS